MSSRRGRQPPSLSKSVVGARKRETREYSSRLAGSSGFAIPARQALPIIRPLSRPRFQAPRRPPSPMNLLRAASIVSLFTLASRITGLARDTMVAALFGAGALTDAFNVAFRIPNLLRRLFAEGAFSQAFVPLLAGARARDGEAATRDLIDAVATVLAWVLVAHLRRRHRRRAGGGLADGVGAGALRPRRRHDARDVPLHRLHVAGGAVGRHPQHLGPLRGAGADAGAAQPVDHRHRLGARAAAGGARRRAGARARRRRHGRRRAAARGAGAGAAAHRHAAAHRRVAAAAARRLAPSRREAACCRQMAPAVLGVSVAQMSLLVNTQIASHVGVGAVSWLFFADRLMEFPSGLLGVALGVVLLPHLSAAQGRADPIAYSALLDWGLRLTLLLALPCAVALLVFPEPLIAVLFHYGALRRRGRAADGARAARLRRRPARADRGEGAGAGLLRAAGHPHAGAHRRRRAGAHAALQLHLRAAARPRRAGAVDQPGGAGQRRAAAVGADARRALPAGARLGPLRAAGRHRHRRDGRRPRLGRAGARLARAARAAGPAHGLARRGARRPRRSSTSGCWR